MKKVVLVLGLVMGTMLVSDALAYKSVSTEMSYSKNDKPKKEVKKKKKSTKSCAGQHSCCKKKTAEAGSK